MFLDQHVMESAIGEIVDQSLLASPKRALAYAILALGTHIVHSEHYKDRKQGCEYEAMIYFNVALGIVHEISTATFSISYFQVSQDAINKHLGNESLLTFNDRRLL